MVKVLAVADEEVPTMPARAHDLGVDLVIAAGDLPWDYLETLASITRAPAAFVPGNHDPHSGAEGVTGPAGFLGLDMMSTLIGGLHVAGLGGCVRYNTGDHQYTQDEYEHRAQLLLERVRRSGIGPVDVLVTHAPPRGLGDGEDPSHIGIEALHGVLDVLQPAWHLHGHIHPYGMLKPDRHVGPTTIRNVIPWQVLEIDARTSASSVSAGRKA